jgi:hypothetical protein
MEPYPFDYQPPTSLERDRAVRWFRSQARTTQRLLKRQNDPKYKTMDPGFDYVLARLLDRYQQAIQRLAKTTFTQRKVTT